MKISELGGVLTGLGEKLEKARVEIVAKIDELRTSLENAEVPADVAAKLDELTAAAQGLDDIVPDQAG